MKLFQNNTFRLAFHDCVKYKDGSGGCDGKYFHDNTELKSRTVKQSSNTKVLSAGKAWGIVIVIKGQTATSSYTPTFTKPATMDWPSPLPLWRKSTPTQTIQAVLPSFQVCLYLFFFWFDPAPLHSIQESGGVPGSSGSL